jgi:hypothetical protein
MNRLTLLGLLVPLAGVAALPDGVARSLAIGVRQVSAEPPADMVKVQFLPGSTPAHMGESKRSWYDWNTLEREVEILRDERRDVAGTFSRQTQTLSASYFITAAGSACTSSGDLEALFVAGVHENGESTIERWTFGYPPSVDGSGAYIPIDQRSLPRVQRREIYRGSSLGRIRSVAIDPGLRYLLFLTRENPTVYRIDLAPGGSLVPTVALDQQAVPYLAQMRSIVVDRHATMGLMYMLMSNAWWTADPSLPKDVIILPDADDDGALEAPFVVNELLWSALGFDGPEAWVRICP